MFRCRLEQFDLKWVAMTMVAMYGAENIGIIRCGEDWPPAEFLAAFHQRDRRNALQSNLTGGTL
jgi:hypothetical protein